MKQLLSPHGLAALSELASCRTLFAFDFDGTLAPIVWHPGDARMSTALRLRLAQLAARVPVAVISGRGLADLQSRLPPEVSFSIGNHGNESTGASRLEEMRATCSGWIAQLRSPLAGFADIHGAELEDKGVTLSLHYRHARDRALAAERISRAAAGLQPAPRVIGGKLVINLLPPGARTKFDALSELAQQEKVERVLFVGDDETDEFVFAQAPPDWLTVRVELDSRSRARYFLQRQAEMAIVLEFLLARVPAAAPSERQAGQRPDGQTPG